MRGFAVYCMLGMCEGSGGEERRSGGKEWRGSEVGEEGRVITTYLFIYIY